MNHRAKGYPPDIWPELGTLPLLERLLPRSPGLPLAILIAVIFLISYGVMLFLHRVPVISEEVDILLDAALMMVLLYPFPVLFVKRPFLSQIRAREYAAEALSESEFRMRMILDNNPYFIAVREKRGRAVPVGREKGG